MTSDRSSGRDRIHRVAAVVTTWLFVLALVTLIVNDAWLKRLFPGVVTGKLSDFAGIAVVGCLLFAAFPRRKGWVSVGIAKAHGLERRECWSRSAATVCFSGSLVDLEYTLVGVRAISFKVAANAMSPIFGPAAWSAPNACATR